MTHLVTDAEAAACRAIYNNSNIEALLDTREALIEALERAVNNADQDPEGEHNSYGTSECGCSWDSGPYGTPCDKHSWNTAARDLLSQLKGEPAEVSR